MKGLRTLEGSINIMAAGITPSKSHIGDKNCEYFNIPGYLNEQKRKNRIFDFEENDKSKHSKYSSSNNQNQNQFQVNMNSSRNLEEEHINSH